MRDNHTSCSAPSHLNDIMGSQCNMAGRCPFPQHSKVSYQRAVCPHVFQTLAVHPYGLHGPAWACMGLSWCAPAPHDKLKLPFGKTAGDHVVFITDWFHTEGNVMAMRVNR